MRARGRRPLLAFTVASALSLCTATAAFVLHRNHELEARELDRAEMAVDALARRDAPPVGVVAGGVVDRPRAPHRYPFLKRRRLVHPERRPLGGPAATPEDKILSDAATRAERDGAFARFLDDGSGRVVAARPVDGGVAVVLTEPLEPPAPYPLWILAGLLGLGALVAHGSSRLQNEAARTATHALALSTLAPPAFVWGGAFAGGLVLLVAVGFALLDSRGHVARAAASARRHRVAYAYLLPAGVGMSVLVLVPFVVGVALGFFDHSRGEWHYVGLQNFASILSGGGRPFTDPLNFWFTVCVTIAWTSINVALHVIIGVALALALRERWMRCRGLFRVLLILPWAIPNYITAIIWNGMFQHQYGAVNAILETFGVAKVSWFSHFITAFTANVTTNTWLGFPFMMVVALGALESIPRDLYEAASVDGATAWQRFLHITLPNLRPALLPAVIMGSIWTFNMFNVIYLVSAGRPGGSTDILVTEAYRWAFERGQRYGVAAAYAVIIFLILVGWTLLWNRVSREARTP